MRDGYQELFHRCPTGPVLTCREVPYPATLVFNAGVCRYQGGYAAVFRNDFGRWRDCGFDGTNLGLATSRDGIRWDVAPRPCIDLEKARALSSAWIDQPDKHLLRFYDPRLTVIDGRVLMCFAVDTTHGLRGGVAVTEDFDRWEVLSMSTPDNRNMVLFPERIGGEYVRLERPMLGYYLRSQRYDIWSSRSPDLRYWGRNKLVLPAEQVPFSNDKIGPGAPPLRTDHGWLTAFHGVHVDPHDTTPHGWESHWPKTYYAGLMLLDLHDPTKVIGMCPHPVLDPTVNEVGQGRTPDDLGFRQNVTFPGALLLDDDGRVRMYYGADDTVVCLATAELDTLITACLKN